MPNKVRAKWRRPFTWPPSEWEFTSGMQKASEVLTAFIFLLLLSTIIGAIFLWPLLLYRTVERVLFGSSEDIRNTLLAVGALIGVPFLIWRTTIAAKQTDISRESHYTALFTKAVEQLGSEKVVKRRLPKGTSEKEAETTSSDQSALVSEYESFEVTERNYEVRLGAIYALERIAQDSRRDAWPIYLTLCSYIANNSPDNTISLLELEKKNTSDIVEIIQVLCRYRGERDSESMAFFQKISIPKVSLFEGEFQDIAFENCQIENLESFKSTRNIKFISSKIHRIHLQGDVNDVTISLSSPSLIEFYSARVNFLHFEKTQVEQLGIQLGIFYGGSINLDSKTVIVRKSEFKNVLFYADFHSYNVNKDFYFDDVKFNECEFKGVSFTGAVLRKCEFKNCRFVDCNIVGFGMETNEDNSFLDCFDEKSLVNAGAGERYDIFWVLQVWRDFKNKRILHSPFESDGV